MNVEECCNLMESHQIRRVPVVDTKGACCGIVAQADVAKHAKDTQVAEVVEKISKSATQSAGRQ
jgi:CBS-domain-containing membrane protein